MNFVKGMDLSTLAELEKCGAKYYDNGEEKDLLEIMKSYDVDTIRIRVWNDPWSEAGESYGAGENDPKTSLEIAKRVTKAGFIFSSLIFFASPSSIAALSLSSRNLLFI